MTTYLRVKHKHLADHNVFNRIQQSERPGNRHQFAEQIDKDLVEASLMAEQSIPRYEKPSWSVELAQTCKKVQLLKKLLSKARTGIRNQEAFTREWQELSSSDKSPTAVQDITAFLREIKRMVRDIVKTSFETKEKEQKNEKLKN